jgi:hypothetical protein
MIVEPSSPLKAAVSTSMSVNCTAMILRSRSSRSFPKIAPKRSLTFTSCVDAFFWFMLSRMSFCSSDDFAAHVVLYQFGGLAIPDSWGRRHLRPLQRLLVSAAGPLAQLLLAGLIVAGLKLGGWLVPFPIAAVAEPLGLYDGRQFASPFALALFMFLLEVNVFWPLLNLVPVPPLDGGQIVREGLVAAGVNDAARISGVIGMATGAAVAWWGFRSGQEFLGIMFAMLAISCFQNLSGPTPWRRWN